MLSRALAASVMSVQLQGLSIFNIREVLMRLNGVFTAKQVVIVVFSCAKCQPLIKPPIPTDENIPLIRPKEFPTTTTASA